MTKLPKKLSEGEETFQLHCTIYTLFPVREYTFAEGHKYRLDFAFVDVKIAVEVDGGNFNGGHSRGKAYEGFCRKINLANDLGWKVYRFTTAMIRSGEGIDTILDALGHGHLIARRTA